MPNQNEVVIMPTPLRPDDCAAALYTGAAPTPVHRAWQTCKVRLYCKSSIQTHHSNGNKQRWNLNLHPQGKLN